MARKRRSRTDEQKGDSTDGSDIRLEPIGAENRQAVRELEVAEAQRHNVDDNRSSLKEAKNDRDARPRAVVAGHRVVGFLMYDASDDEALLYRFMIDHREQGRGYGRKALSALIEEISALGHVRDVIVCYVPENEAARRLYHSAGFVDDDVDEDGEILARLRLANRTRRP